jgi:hypothetical protein
MECPKGKKFGSCDNDAVCANCKYDLWYSCYTQQFHNNGIEKARQKHIKRELRTADNDGSEF